MSVQWPSYEPNVGSYRCVGDIVTVALNKSRYSTAITGSGKYILFGRSILQERSLIKQFATVRHIKID